MTRPKRAPPAAPTVGDPAAAESFARWLDDPDPDAPRVRTYHVGDLAADSGTLRVDRAGRPYRSGAEDPAVAAVADAAWAAREAGRVTLTRRRLDGPGPPRFEYLAVRIPQGRQDR